MKKTTNSQGLKSCPFCGEIPRDTVLTFEKGRCRTLEVYCTCGINLTITRSGYAGLFPVKGDVRKVWNRRAE